jgi:hypothetical protein
MWLLSPSVSIDSALFESFAERFFVLSVVTNYVIIRHVDLVAAFAFCINSISFFGDGLNLLEVFQSSLGTCTMSCTIVHVL